MKLFKLIVDYEEKYKESPLDLQESIMDYIKFRIKKDVYKYLYQTDDTPSRYLYEHVIATEKILNERLDLLKLNWGLK